MRDGGRGRTGVTAARRWLINRSSLPGFLVTVCDTPAVTARLAPPPVSNGHPSLLTQTVDVVRPRSRRVRGWLTRVGRRVVARVAPVLGTALGLAAFTVAAFLWAVIPGCLVLGVALILLEWRVRG